MKVQPEWSDIGQRVREARLAAKMSQEELGRQIGLDRTMVAKVESGVRRIDAVELVRLSASLDLPLSHFLYERPAVLSRRAPLLDEGAAEISRESFRLEAELVSWLRDVRQLRDLGVLRTRSIVRYQEAVTSEDAARDAAIWVRNRLHIGAEPIPSLMTLCEDAGLYVAVVDLPGDGASVIDDDLAAAVVSRLGDPVRRRATAAHELGHATLGDEYSSDLGVHTSRAERENAIDAFAAELLLPSSVIKARRREFNRDTLVQIAASYRTSWSLAVRQSIHAGALDGRDITHWLPHTPTRAELLDATGWTPQPDLDWIRVPPSYAHAVLEARKRSLITTARAVELMRGQVEKSDLPPVDEDSDL